MMGRGKGTLLFSIITILILQAALSYPGSAVGSEIPTEQRGEVDSIVVSSNRFAIDLYGELAGEEGNLFFSPFSISAGIAMTYAGAAGITKEEMAEVFYFPPDEEEMHEGYKWLLTGLRKEGEAGIYNLHIANRLWGDEGYTFLKPFLRTVKVNYGAGLERVSFARKPEEARRTINLWIEEQTERRIINLLPPGSVDPDDKLILTNAVFFSGEWDRKFDPAHTKDLPFYPSSVDTILVPQMSQEGRFLYAQDTEIQILELMYKGENLSMVILLPAEVEGISDLEKRLTLLDITVWVEALEETRLRVVLPRFLLTKQFGLKALLSEMGMPSAFGPGTDFSPMDGTKNLFISQVHHKSFVEVDEKGTEAAAATAVVMGWGAEKEIFGEIPTFRADHPFLFLIRDRETGLVLFMGRVVNPQG